MSSISIAKLFSFRRAKVLLSDVTESYADYAGVVLTPDQRYAPMCSKCHTPGKAIHASRSRSVRDLPIGPYRRTWVLYHYRLVDCRECGEIHTEASEVADVGGPRVTKRFAQYIRELCRLLPVKQVADHLGLDWKTVKNIDKQGLEAEFDTTDYSNLRVLAIDEISYARYQKYLTVVLDYESGRVVWVGKDRTRQTLQQFFAEMPPEVRANIEAVAMDMWEPFAQAVKEACPQAAIVYDFFHIVANYSHVIDDVRRQEFHKAGQQDRRAIKGSRWLLLKNPEHLKESEKPRLEELLALNEPLAKVYILKEDLKSIWSQPSRAAMAEALDDWCVRALQANLKPLTRFVKLLETHTEGILNHAEFPIHTGKLEGVNNKIKVIKRESYGFHDLEYFCLKIKQRCHGRR